MKKILFLVMAMMLSLTASAQFVIYKSVPDPPSRSSQSTYNPYNGYETNPYGNYYRSPQPRAKQYNLTGYYHKADGWYKTPIKVSVQGDEIILASVKVGNNWAPCNSNVSEVGAFDPQEIQENFNYKGYLSFLGPIYF